MDKRTGESKPEKSNEISEETGQFDARFMLWRVFCMENNVPVETLPSELTGETKEKWEQIKNERLHNEEEGAKQTGRGGEGERG